MSLSRSRPRCLRLLVFALLATLVVAFSLVAGASPALASSPPSLQFDGNGNELAYGPYGTDIIYVYSTRLVAYANIFDNELVTKWRAEYSTSKSALESGSGTVASSGEQKPFDEDEYTIYFGPRFGAVVGGFGGESEAEGNHEVHHLVPDTHYYAQFVAENADGKTVLPFEFITAPILAPEVGTDAETESGTQGTTAAPLADVGVLSPTKVKLNAKLESNGAATSYSFGYSTSPSGPVTICASGSISVAEDFAEPSVECTGLAPETTYYPHLIATNGKGTLDQTEFMIGLQEVNTFTTETAKPVSFQPEFRNVTATSAHVTASVWPHGEETRWRFETAESVLGPWAPVAGAAGTISQVEAEAFPGSGGGVFEGATLTGLVPAKTYYVRLFAEDVCAVGCGEGQNVHGEPILTEVKGFGSFETDSPPVLSTFAVHALDGELPRVIGAVDPNDPPTSAEQSITIAGAPTGGTFTLAFNGQRTAPVAYNAPASGSVGSVQKALEELPADPNVSVEGSAGGPYTVTFNGTGAEPVIEADGSGLVPSGTVGVVVVQQGGATYETHEYFQYVSEAQFKGEGEWSRATSTPEVDVGSGTESSYAAVDLPGLTAGETYRYRIAVHSTFPGSPVLYGEERTLTAPAASVSVSVSCPNEALRAGVSARLPDCRGYEQVTPADKEGAREPFTYGGAIGAGLLIGEDGARVMLEDPVEWGAGPAAGQGPYLFSREGDGGWRRTAAAVQPQTGVDDLDPELFASDLGGFAFQSVFTTSPERESKEVEYEAGPAGGPYVTVASVPANENGGLGWVAASRDFSKLFLSVADHTLLGHATGTRSGGDLYEYAEGELSQVNVSGGAPGSTIGACGANIVRGDESKGTVSSAHAVSSDGSRVFFEAVPGSDCSEAKHLYMRVGGESTVDIGAYTFIAANAEGSDLLLEKRNAEVGEFFSYETQSASVKPLFTVPGGVCAGCEFVVSEDLSTIYFHSPERLSADAPSTPPSGGGFIYRYDVPDEKLTVIAAIGGPEISAKLAQVSQDGQDLYFTAVSIEGVPGGHEQQVYRYDSGESVVQCMSCASSSDPEPKLLSLFGETGGAGGMLESRTGYPRTDFASGNGDYAFFDTPSALLPSDIDGEAPPEGRAGDEFSSVNFSVSSDVYEWRKLGVDGCAHVQGCLALITNGRGGFLSLFLGTDESGQDAFIYTSEKLGPRDNDTAGDIYDAHIDGGEPPLPQRPVECEGDACSTPPSAPNDATPSSLTFTGEGNIAQLAPATKPAVKPTKPKTKTKKKKKANKKKASKKRKRKAKKSAKGSSNNRRGT